MVSELGCFERKGLMGEYNEYVEMDNEKVVVIVFYGRECYGIYVGFDNVDIVVNRLLGWSWNDWVFVDWRDI